MLKQLHIKNFTLIEQLDIPFDGGFSVITGETGAGKSIILGALGLLLGQRADNKTIKSGRERCVIEAHFDLSRYDMAAFFEDNDLDYDATDTILRRELSSNGKSRAFVNDTPVPLSTLKELGSRLVDIHSQHQNLLLNKEDFQLSVVDTIADNEAEREQYHKAYEHYKALGKALEEAREALRKHRENEDFIRFQHHELEEAHLVEGEQEELEQEYGILSHAEEIKSALYEADSLLSGDGGIVERLKGALTSVDGVTKVYPAIADAAQRIESCFIELKDIADDVSRHAETVDFDPLRLEAVSDRIDTIYRLQQKFHVERVEQLIALCKDFEQQLNQIDGGDEHLQELEAKWKAQERTCTTLAKTLNATREQAARKVEEEMRQRLVPLGIPKVRFEVQLTEKPLSADGCDKVSFLFTANSNTPLQPVAQVASGGEIARVMLSLKAMISGKVKLPTIIFDEIDTGVSGKVAEMMARIMREMGAHERQVISITHLPQIAALGKHHYKVYKEEGDMGTVSHMRQLTAGERVGEIAQMLSGSAVSEAAIKNAEELLKNNTNN
ncbi:MAG: DNA repair protein RecN [Prevotella sp.]|nr:DNA repair protein RecN [Prevotella sp.]